MFIAALCRKTKNGKHANGRQQQRNNYDIIMQWDTSEQYKGTNDCYT